MGLARECRLRAGRRHAGGALYSCSAPGHAQTDGCKAKGIDDFGRCQRRKIHDEEEEMRLRASPKPRRSPRSRRQPGSPARKKIGGWSWDRRQDDAWPARPRRRPARPHRDEAQPRQEPAAAPEAPSTARLGGQLAKNARISACALRIHTYGVYLIFDFGRSATSTRTNSRSRGLGHDDPNRSSAVSKGSFKGRPCRYHHLRQSTGSAARIDLMGAPMSFLRNAEICGRRAGRIPLQV